uniref:Uncharacterized protein n=1 Tax=Rhizophora mucronata TaxID=61149 RepID=A0A2P2J816_RHIMU
MSNIKWQNLTQVIPKHKRFPPLEFYLIFFLGLNCTNKLRDHRSRIDEVQF